MPSAQATAQVIKEALQAFLRELKQAGQQTGTAIIRPRILERHADGVSRTGQVLAFLVLGPVILVSITIVEVLNELMAGVLGTGLIEDGQLTITGFMITALTLFFLILAAWGWFQWVRTGAFGAFRWD